MLHDGFETNMIPNSISLLRPSILYGNPRILKKIDNLRLALGKELGWHYIVDLVWTLLTIEEMELPKGATILDAGAGNGLLQYLLADLDYQIICVDFSNVYTPTFTKLLYSVENLEGEQQNNDQDYKIHIKRVIKFINKRFSLLKFFWLLLRTLFHQRQPGKNNKISRRYARHEKIELDSIDAVVSISAIEHLSIMDLPRVRDEFERVIKPGGFIAITTSASKSDDWFHEPSKGWCLSITRIREFMELPEDTINNFEYLKTIIEEYKQSNELINRLSSGYYRAGNNGMPWEFWDPKYIPVGIIKHVTK